jgi:dTDP-4-dehydrorhamnose 3,5-epimerase
MHKKLDDVLIFDNKVFDDNRGSFVKDYVHDWFGEINFSLKEKFYTYSKSGVIRAIHFQNVKQQAKLIRCVSGKIFDVVVDLRPDSPNFGDYQSFVLDGLSSPTIYVPEGFGHGYLVIEDAIVSYGCNEVFYPEYDDAILYNDIDINIEWPIDLVKKIILSEKDINAQSFNTFKTNNL